jgi:oligopeptide transport system substrate-binding protein
MIWRRKLAAAFCLTVLSLTLSMSGGARAGGTLRRLDANGPVTLDPIQQIGAPGWRIALDLFEGLTAYDNNGAVIPGIATSWAVSSDGLRWTFHLRGDAKWSNGDPLTSEDFLYSLRRCVNPATASPAALDDAGMIVNGEEIIAGREKDVTKLGVEAPDAQTLVINLRTPVPYLPAQLVTLSLPVNRKAIEAYGVQWDRPGNIVSNGPFVLIDWVAQSQIVLHRNPTYHAADQVQLDEVRWVAVEDTATALKLYRAGELDISRLPETDLALARKNFPDDLHQAQQLAVEYLVLNMRIEPFASNFKLREALALAIDRDVLSSRVIDPGSQFPTASFVPPMGAGYQPQVSDYTLIPEQDRLATARKLMIEAGYPRDNPLKLTALYVNDRTTKKRLLSLAATWKQELGVELTLQNREWQAVQFALTHGDFPLSWTMLTSDIADPMDFLAICRSIAGENQPGYYNPAYDALLSEAEAEVDPGRRMKLLEQAEHMLLNDTPLIPIDHPVTLLLVSPRVTGWGDNIVGVHPSRYLGLKFEN